MPAYAISDIHGCRHTFEALLDQLAFTTRDTLYLLGDYIDRGPHSKEVIDYIWALQQQGYQLHCLRGNHEQLVMEALVSRDVLKSWYQYNGGDATAQSFRRAGFNRIPGAYVNWMLDLDYYHSTPDYLLVHAGLNFALPDPLVDHHSMLWARDWYPTIDHAWLGERLVVHGHTPQTCTQARAALKNLHHCPVVNIDTGCVYNIPDMGHLCAFLLDDRKMVFQRRVAADEPA